MDERQVMEMVQADQKGEAEAEKTLMDGKVEMSYNGIKCFIEHPTVQQDAEIERYCASRFLTLLDQGVPTQRSIRKKLEKTGDWTKDDEKDFQDAQLRYRDYYKEYLSVKPEERIDNPKYDELAQKVRKSMDNLMALHVQRDLFFSHSAERKLEIEATLRRMTLCIKKEDGTPLFASMDAIQAEPNSQEFSTLLMRAMSFWRGVDERFLEE